MAFTYTLSFDAAGTAPQKRNVIRHLLRDIDSTRKIFDDEEIDFHVSTDANVWMAAAMLAEVALGTARGLRAKEVGDTRLEYLAARAPMWRARGLGHQKPYAGGVSISDKEILETDSDWPLRDFARDLHDHDGADDQGSALKRAK